MAPSHYLNQHWNIVNLNLRNKLQWKFHRNSNIFIEENALENVVCKMASILSQTQSVDNKMTTVSLMKYIFLCVKCCNFDLNFTEHSPRGPVNNKPVKVDSVCLFHDWKWSFIINFYDRSLITRNHDHWLIAHLTHWGRVTHICVSKLSIFGSDNGLSPGRRQAIIWTNAGILLIGTLGTNFSEILIEIPIFSFKKMGLKVSSAKWGPFCPGLNVLTRLSFC